MLSFFLSVYCKLVQHPRDFRKLKWKYVESECFSLILSDTQEAKRDSGLNRGSQIAVHMYVRVCGLIADWALSLQQPALHINLLDLIKNSPLLCTNSTNIFIIWNSLDETFQLLCVI